MSSITATQKGKITTCTQNFMKLCENCINGKMLSALDEFFCNFNFSLSVCLSLSLFQPVVVIFAPGPQALSTA